TRALGDLPASAAERIGARRWFASGRSGSGLICPTTHLTDSQGSSWTSSMKARAWPRRGGAQRCGPWPATSAALVKAASATQEVSGVVATGAMAGAACGEAERVQGEGSGRLGEARRQGNE